MSCKISAFKSKRHWSKVNSKILTVVETVIEIKKHRNKIWTRDDAKHLTPIDQLEERKKNVIAYDVQHL